MIKRRCILPGEREVLLENPFILRRQEAEHPGNVFAQIVTVRYSLESMLVLLLEACLLVNVDGLTIVNHVSDLMSYVVEYESKVNAEFG
jgi:hypothetical protein